MKVAILSTAAWRTPPKNYGGYEWVASNLSEGLVEKNVDVTLFATGDSITSAKHEWVIPKGYEEDESVNPRMWETMHIANVFEKADNFDIIHNLIDIIPLTYSRLVNTPVVTTFHGIPNKSNLPVYKRYNKDNYYVAISKSAKKPEDLFYSDVIYHGIDTKIYTFTEKKENYLFCMARIHPEKGIHNAIKIAKKAKRILIIAGIIQDQKYFDNEISPHIDGKNIKFIGPVGGEIKVELMANAFAFLHPIEFDEPFGLSVVEAQASGTPVIAYNRGSMPEVIKNGKTGFLVSNTNEAISAIGDVRKINNKDCRVWVEKKFSRSRMVDSYLKLYKRILRQHPGAG